VDPTWIFEVWPQLIRSSFSQLFTWKAGLKTVNKQSKFDKFVVLKTVEKIRQHYPPLYKHNTVTVAPEILIHFFFFTRDSKIPNHSSRSKYPERKRFSSPYPPRSVKATRRSLSYYSIFVVRSLKLITVPDR
jgi:hypothetical protein